MLEIDYQTINSLLGQVLNQQEVDRRRSALANLESMLSHAHFCSIILDFALYDQVSQSVKILSLSFLEKAIRKRSQRILQNGNFISNIIGMLKSSIPSTSYKKQLIAVVERAFHHTMFKTKLRQLVLQQLGNKEINYNEDGLIYIFYLALSEKHGYFSEQSEQFCLKIHHFLVGMVNYYLSKQQYGVNQLIQLVGVLQKAHHQLRFVNEQQLSTIYGQSFVDMITNCLETFSLTESNIRTLQTQVSELLSNIIRTFIFTVKNSFFNEIPFFYKVSDLLSILSRNLKFIVENELNTTWAQFIHHATDTMTLLFRRNCFHEAFSNNKQRIIQSIIGIFSLHKENYDQFYNDPKKFIQFVESMFIGNQSIVEDYFLEYQSHREKQQCDEMDGYKSASYLFRQILKRDEKMFVDFFQLIFEVLRDKQKINCMTYSASLIILCIIQPQLTKRPHLLQQTIEYLITQIFQREIPTNRTEQPDNIQYILLLQVIQHYFHEIVKDELYDYKSKLFELLENICISKKVKEQALLFQTLNFFHLFIYQANFQNIILSLINEYVISNKDPYITDECLKIYQSILKTLIPEKINLISEPLRIAIKLIEQNIHVWSQRKEYFLVERGVKVVCLCLQLEYSNSYRIGYIQISIILQILENIYRNMKPEVENKIVAATIILSTYTQILNSSYSDAVILNEAERLLCIIVSSSISSGDNNFEEAFIQFLEQAVNKIQNKDLINTIFDCLNTLIDSFFQDFQHIKLHKFLVILQQLLVEHCDKATIFQLKRLYEVITNKRNSIEIQDANAYIKSHLFVNQFVLRCIISNMEDRDIALKEEDLRLFLQQKDELKLPMRAKLILSIVLIRLTQAIDPQLNFNLIKESIQAILQLLENTSTASEMVQQQSIEAEKDYLYRSYQMKHVQLNIDEWKEFKLLIHKLQQNQCLPLLFNLLSQSQKETLTRSLQCCRLENNKSRIILHVKKF